MQTLKGRSWLSGWFNQTVLLLVAALVVVQLFGSNSGDTILERVITVLFIQVILVVSLQMFMGNSGVASFAHIGFMGIGAYISIILTLGDRMKGVALPNLYPLFVDMRLPFFPTLIVAGLIAALVAALFGFPLMRLSGAASVIATFALLVIIHIILLNWNEMTNGPRTVFGVDALTTSWWSAGWAIVTVIVSYWFKESRIGLMLRASREDDKAAISVGINIVMMRWFAFIAGAFFAGVAGGLYAHFITSFGAGAFYLELTFVILAMLVIGGTGSVSGAVIGVLAVTLLSEGIRSIENGINIAQSSSAAATGFMGALASITATIFPNGIAGATEVIVSIVMVLMLILRPSGITGNQEIRLPFFKGGATQAPAQKPQNLEGEI
jgi:branched-chain amino acid transport system permease protein